LGKPYASELQLLAGTYEWAMGVSVDSLAQAIANTATTSLLTVGSGGSLTAAQYAARLHEFYTGQIARAVTPLEVVSATRTLRDVSLFFLSAGGKNPDIIGALKQTIVREPQRLIVCCSRRRSPLAALTNEFRYANLIEYTFPFGKDGFLATNSLLAFMVLLRRAYMTAFSDVCPLPARLEDLVHPGKAFDEYLTELKQQCEPLWGRETLVVLYGFSCRSAALDLESKFTEAALGATLPTDYRNFAHGRHHWLAKRGETTGIVALISRDDDPVASKTLRHVPDTIPVAQIKTPLAGLCADLAMLVSVFHIVGFAGEERGVDPGRPGVPEFGRKIYNMRTFSGPSSSPRSLPTSEALAIERKTKTSIESLTKSGQISFWRTAYKDFTSRLQEHTFRHIVFDYDGTLCDERNRYTGLGEGITAHLAKLLEAGILIGIATGRGKSVKEELRSKFPTSLWQRILVGYYNGSDIGFVDEDKHPDPTASVCEPLKDIAEILQDDTAIGQWCDCTYRHQQITVEPKSAALAKVAWDAVQQALSRINTTGVMALRSSHSLDIVAPGVSKRQLVNRMVTFQHSSVDDYVLCIGDRGQFPGNDYALLQEPHSLSVDEISHDPQTCWNLAPGGYRGVQATDYYLRSLDLTNQGAKFRLVSQ
jgi:fructoselysine-6-P-deglycase FrlB-like protein